MSGLAGTSQFLRIALRVAIETLHFHKAQTGLFLMTTLFHIKGTKMNNLAPMKIVLGCQVGQI